MARYTAVLKLQRICSKMPRTSRHYVWRGGAKKRSEVGVGGKVFSGTLSLSPETLATDPLSKSKLPNQPTGLTARLALIRAHSQLVSFVPAMAATTTMITLPMLI